MFNSSPLEYIISEFKNAKTYNDLNNNRLRDTIFNIFPQSAMMWKYDQLSHAHQYDLWDHSIYTVLGIPKNINDDMLYLAAFLHDIGKPSCRVPDAKNRTDNKGNLNHFHYFSHPEEGCKIIERMNKDFFNKYKTYMIIDKSDYLRLLWYVLHHDDHLSTKPSSIKHILDNPKYIEKGVFEVDSNTFKNLMYLHISDAKAHIIESSNKIEDRINIATRLSTATGIRYFELIKKCGCNGLGRLDTIYDDHYSTNRKF